MAKGSNRDDFTLREKDVIAKRASFICSNPDCRVLTICPSETDEEKFISMYKIAHITAASEGGPRYDSSLTPDLRHSVENGIFLCSNCADMIDKNKGVDFSADLLRNWKKEHEKWIKENLNKSLTSPFSTIDGEHHAKGKGKVTAIDVREPTFFRPGTKSIAEGDITATRIEYKGGQSK